MSETQICTVVVNWLSRWLQLVGECLRISSSWRSCWLFSFVSFSPMIFSEPPTDVCLAKHPPPELEKRVVLSGRDPPRLISSLPIWLQLIWGGDIWKKTFPLSQETVEKSQCLGLEPDLRSPTHLITVHLASSACCWKETPGAAHIHKAEGERAANLWKKYQTILRSCNSRNYK